MLGKPNYKNFVNKVEKFHYRQIIIRKVRR